MKKHFCRTFSLLLAAVTLLTVLSAGISVSAVENGQVKIETTTVTYTDGTQQTSSVISGPVTLVDGKVPANLQPTLAGWTLDGWATAPITYKFWWDQEKTFKSWPVDSTMTKEKILNLGWHTTADDESMSSFVPDSETGFPQTSGACHFYTWLWKSDNNVRYDKDAEIPGDVTILYPVFKPTAIGYALYGNGYCGSNNALYCGRQYGAPFGTSTLAMWAPGVSSEILHEGWYDADANIKIEPNTPMKKGKSVPGVVKFCGENRNVSAQYYIRWRNTKTGEGRNTLVEPKEGDNREVYGGFEHSHTFDYSNYDCTQPLKCTTCDYQLPAAYTTHKMDTAWTWGSETHCHRCLNPNCKYVEGAANHTWVYANGKEAACADKRCSVCNYRVSGSSVHRNVPSTYYTDSTYHWQICNDCGLKVNRIAHKWVQKSDDNAHWDECSVCGKTKNKTAHTLTQKTDGQYHWQVCTVCGKEVSKTAHYASSYQHDGSSHWQVCASCGTVFGKTAHVPGAPVVTTTNNGSTTTTQTVITCTVCGYQISSTTATLENEKPKPAATATPAPAATATPTPAATSKPAAPAAAAPAATPKPAATATPAPAATPKPATSTATVSVSQFKDVKATAYYAAPVAWAVENGITSGTSATTFGPAVSCTRGQAVTFLWNAAGKPEPTSTANPFTDVKPTDYYYKAVLWAKEKGVTSGTSATTFGPNVACTRAQIVTFLWNANGKPAPQSTSSSFTDVRTSDYYSKAVLWAKENGVTSGTSATTFGSNASCNRGQIVTFLYNDAN